MNLQKKLQFFVIFMGITLNTISSYAESTPIDIRKGQIVCIPVYINQQDSNIIGIDFTLSYSSLIFEIGDITLEGGFLEKDYSLTIGKQIKDEVSLGIYASGGIRKGSGIIANIYFECKRFENNHFNVSIKKYQVNDLSANGGLVWDNINENQLEFAIKKCTLKDLINNLQILCGIQSMSKWIDMNGNNVAEMNDVLRLMMTDFLL